jgi:hypothetical protein
MQSPLVKAAFAAFPDAELIEGGDDEKQWSKTA